MHSGAVPVPEQFDEEHRCREFTPEHSLDVGADSEVFGAAICPGCQHSNPLTGEPADFAGKVVRCMGCTRVLVLDGTALLDWVTEVAADGV